MSFGFSYIGLIWLIMLFIPFFCGQGINRRIIPRMVFREEADDPYTQIMSGNRKFETPDGRHDRRIIK